MPVSPGCTDMKRAVPLHAIPSLEAICELLLQRFHSYKDKDQFHLTQPASSICLGGICCARVLLARHRLLGGVLEKSHVLARTHVRDQHIFLQACTGSMISQEICALPACSPPVALCQSPLCSASRERQEARETLRGWAQKCKLF